jgi:hypothetical protein
MGLSYSIIPTKIVLEEEGFLSHFEAIDAYEFPTLSDFDPTSRYPTLSEIYEAIALADLKIESGGMQSTDYYNDQTTQAIARYSYQLSYHKYKYSSDFTFRHLVEQIDNPKLTAMMGITPDFRILLRLSTALTKICGSMIIFSAYDVYYVDKEKSFEEIWDKVKLGWSYDDE